MARTPRRDDPREQRSHTGQGDNRLEPGAHWGLRCYRNKVLIEVATLDVLAAFTRPLQRDPGVLSRTPAVKFCPEVVGPCTTH
jgi:hypothetical protein